MGITKRSILLSSSERVHITLRQKQRVEQKLHGHGHIRGRALPPWPLGAARRAVRRGQRCQRSRIQGDRGASAQRRPNAGRSGYASGGLGTEAHRRSCFTPPETHILGLALPSRSTPTTASPNIFWQSKPHSKIGKQRKTSVARTGPRITSLASGVAILTWRADQGRDCGAAEIQRLKLLRAGLT